MDLAEHKRPSVNKAEKGESIRPEEAVPPHNPVPRLGDPVPNLRDTDSIPDLRGPVPDLRDPVPDLRD